MWAQVAFSHTVYHHNAHNGWAQELFLAILFFTLADLVEMGVLPFAYLVWAQETFYSRTLSHHTAYIVWAQDAT